MVDNAHRTPIVKPMREGVAPEDVPYDKRKLSYAGTFTNPWKSTVIRTMEWCTGKITLLRKIRQFERMGPETGHGFWKQARGLMGIDLQTPREQIERIPAEGPVVVVANHPHGLVDGMMLAELIGEVRQDYKILTRSLLTGVDEVAQFMLPVPFPHEEDSFNKSLEMRKTAMGQLAKGGLIALFPSGSVAASNTFFGPAVEGEWNAFTAKMITRSKATVIPIFFPGQNSRAYQIANQLSATLRQGLLIHEVANSFNRPQKPIIGAPIAPEKLAEKSGNATEFMAWLREHTISLGNQGKA